MARGNHKLVVLTPGELEAQELLAGTRRKGEPKNRERSDNSAAPAPPARSTSPPVLTVVPAVPPPEACSVLEYALPVVPVECLLPKDPPPENDGNEEKPLPLGPMYPTYGDPHAWELTDSWNLKARDAGRHILITWLLENGADRKTWRRFTKYLSDLGPELRRTVAERFFNECPYGDLARMVEGAFFSSRSR